MEQMTIDYLLACGYLLLWVLTLAVYQYKNHDIDGGTSIIATYVLYAVFSIVTISDPVFSLSFEELHLFPYLYLYVMLMLALLPVIYNHINPAQRIANPQTKLLKYISIVIIVCGLLQIPDIIANFQTGIVKLFLDSDAGKDAYRDHLGDVEGSGKAIRNLPAVVFNSLFDISVFLCFYMLTLRKTKKDVWLITGLAIAIFIGTLQPVMQGIRGNVIISLLTVILGYMFFRRYLSRLINRIVQTLGIIAISIIALPIIAITVSRFDERSSSGIAGALYWYIGQGSLYFNNYGLDAGGIRNGDRTANLFKRLVDPETPQNFAERRDKYYYLEMDDHYFTTFVGDFTIDYGPVAAFVIFVVFNLIVVTQIRPRDGTLRLDQMLLIFFTACICMQGGMTLFAYSDTAGLRIVTQGLLYTYLRLHSALLLHFPKESYPTRNNEESHTETV